MAAFVPPPVAELLGFLAQANIATPTASPPHTPEGALVVGNAADDTMLMVCLPRRPRPSPSVYAVNHSSASRAIDRGTVWRPSNSR